MVKKNSEIKSICMLSTHGYFDPIPELGKTDTGGQVVYVLQLSKALTARNVTVDIYTRWFDRAKKQIDPLPDCRNARVIRIPAGPWEFIPKEEIYSILPELKQNMTAFIGEQNSNYDLFHGHYVDAGIVTIQVAEEFEKPSFFTAHSLGAWKRDQMKGDPEEMEKKFRFNHRISEELRIFESVKAQVVTTKVQAEKIAQLYGYESDNIVVIPPGVDVHNFCSIEPGTRWEKGGLPDRYILCLGRIDSNKGHDLLLNAFDKVRDAVSDIHLVIGGGSQEPEQREAGVLATMKKIIDKKGMHEKVHIIGYVPDEDLVPLYQHAEIFVLPSIFEPFGMTALEAMACGVPVIASSLGGIRNAISSGTNGLLVDPREADEFADAMITLLRDRPLSERMRKEGYETIHKYYSWEVIADRHIEFYKRFIQ